MDALFQMIVTRIQQPSTLPDMAVTTVLNSFLLLAVLPPEPGIDIDLLRVTASRTFLIDLRKAPRTVKTLDLLPKTVSARIVRRSHIESRVGYSLA
jgi:hypothetical protein